MNVNVKSKMQRNAAFVFCEDEGNDDRRLAVQMSTNERRGKRRTGSEGKTIVKLPRSIVVVYWKWRWEEFVTHRNSAQIATAKSEWRTRGID